MFDVVVIGDALIDEVRLADRTLEAVGGSALNVAVGLRVLGATAELISMVGDDEDAACIEVHLQEAHIPLLKMSAPLGTARAISTRTNGEPRYVFNEAARRRRITFDQAAAVRIDLAMLVAVSGIALDEPHQADDILSVVRDPRSRLVLDANPRAGMLNDCAAFVASLFRLASDSLLVKVSDEDAELLGFSEIDELTKLLLDVGARYVLATAGAEGATLSTSDWSLHIPIARAEGPIVDTMGAGDATLATTISGLLPEVPLNREAWEPILAEAMATAAWTCRVVGPALQTHSPLGAGAR